MAGSERAESCSRASRTKWGWARFAARRSPLTSSPPAPPHNSTSNPTLSRATANAPPVRCFVHTCVLPQSPCTHTLLCPQYSPKSTLGESGVSKPAGAAASTSSVLEQVVRSRSAQNARFGQEWRAAFAWCAAWSEQFVSRHAARQTQDALALTSSAAP